MNRIAAQLAQPDAARRSHGIGDDAIASVRGSLSSVAPDFWSVVGHTELDMYVALAREALAGAVDGLIAEFRDHHNRVSSPWMWGSVLDNARFVLVRYAKRAPNAEAAAAERLLTQLESLAGPPPADETGAAATPIRPRSAPAERKRKRGSKRPAAKVRSPKAAARRRR
jgi:hypothetical protein